MNYQGGPSAEPLESGDLLTYWLVIKFVDKRVLLLHGSYNLKQLINGSVYET
jgi:hypothetical protein